MNLPITKKAYVGWDIKSEEIRYLTASELDQYLSDKMPVYADNEAMAKREVMREIDSMRSDYSEVKYTDIRVRRARSCDMVMFESMQKLRGSVESIIAQRNVVKRRRSEIEKFPDDAMFYLQNGYVGNCILWWGKGDKGYTTEITKAAKYTKQEILKSYCDFGPDRHEVIWEASHVEMHISRTVDAQKLDSKMAIS